MFFGAAANEMQHPAPVKTPDALAMIARPL